MNAKDLVKSSGITELPSGLLVPDSVAKEQIAADRKSVRWTMDKWRQYRRMFSNLMRDHILIAPHCGDCNVKIELVDLDPPGLVTPGKANHGVPNKFALRCNCTDRVMVQGV